MNPVTLIHAAWALAIALAGAATVTERATGHVPNVIPFAACGAGLVLAGARGSTSFELAVLGLLICLVPGILAWQRGAVGGGAVKLLGGVGALLGARPACEALGVILVALVVVRLTNRWRGGRDVLGSPLVLLGALLAVAVEAARS